MPKSNTTKKPDQVQKSKSTNPVKPALRIEKRGDSIKVQVLIEKRFAHYGHGTFLEAVKPGEISISSAAKEAILRCRYLSGVQGMEIFSGKIISWGTPDGYAVIPLSSVSFHNGAAQWFSRCATVAD